METGDMLLYIQHLMMLVILLQHHILLELGPVASQQVLVY
jgi:hypothetical protein